MSDPNRSDNWRLEESGDTAGHWKLEETEQNRISQWELQNDDAYMEEAGWQPVEYTRDPYQQQSGGSGWVLPSLVGLALIAVVAYGAWIGMTQLDLNNFGSLIPSIASTPLPTSDTAAVAQVDETATPVGEAVATEVVPPTDTPPAPTATEAPPTATPVPALVEEQYVTVIEQYGINARTTPSTDGEVLRVVGQNEEFLVLDEELGWLQILSAAGQPAWISSDSQFVSLRTVELPVDEANRTRAQLGVDLLPGGTAVVEGGVTPVAALPTTAPIAGGDSLTDTNVITDSSPGVDTGGAVVAGTVNITAGLNARSLPDANSELVALLENGTELTLTGRLADNSWFRSSLADETTIWVFAEFVETTGDVTTLPVIDVPGVAVSAPDVTSTDTLTTTTAVSDTTEPPLADTGVTTPTVGTDEPATASVNTILGAAIRNAPEDGADAIATAIFENVLTVTGRSADSRWLQVDLGADGSGWVLVNAVDLSVPLESVPVVNP